MNKLHHNVVYVLYKTSIFEYSTKTPERTRKRLHARSHVDGTIQKGHRKIMQTKDAYMKNDHFDAEEATEAAIDKRKFLIKRLLKDYSFSKESNDEDD